MRVWLYARLSGDDDPAQNSLQNQQAICRAFAEKRGDTIVGCSSDDNVSGMSFSRRGLDALAAAAQAGKLDAVLTKDLSRLGRHKTQTALFIDYLREHQVRVISVTEGIDTFREEDDLILGVRGLMNDYYAKDISKKIRAGYRQKQKDGLVIRPPFGYWKDKIRTGFSSSRRPQKRCAASMRCICRAADKRKLPAGSMRWTAKRPRSFGQSRSGMTPERRTKPETGSSSGRMPA